MKVEAFLELLEGVRKSGDGWVAKCPSHEDGNPSLSVGVGRDEKILVKCHGGCQFEQVLAAVGMEPSDLMDQAQVKGVTLSELAYRCGMKASDLLEYGLKDSISREGQPCVDIPYRDRMGNLHGVKTRLALDKGSPKFTWTKKAEHPIPYGLWRLPLSAGTLVICEGESDTWTMWHTGYHALGIPGATATKCLTTAHFRGVNRVLVCQDRNAPGIAFAAEISAFCEAAGVPATTLVPPEPFVDVTQWRATVGPEKFASAVADAAKKPAGDARASRIDGLEAEPNRFLIFPALPLREVTLLTGSGGSGKSTIAYTLASILSRGMPLVGMRTVRARSLIISREDAIAKDVAPRLAAAGVDPDYVRAYDFSRAGNLPTGSKAFAQAVAAAADLAKAKFVIIDPVVSFFDREGDLNSASDVRAWLQPLLDVATSCDLAVMLVMHHNKSGGIFGSVDFINAARSVLQVYDDPTSSLAEKRYALLHTKANRTLEGSPLRFSLTGSSEVVVREEGDEQVIEQVSSQRVEWLGMTHLTAAEIMSVKATDREQVREMAIFAASKVDYVMDEEVLLEAIGDRFGRVSRTLRLIAIKCSGLEWQRVRGANSWSPAGTLTGFKD